MIDVAMGFIFSDEGKFLIAKRKDFLFRTRNRYTHDVTETGNASAAVFPGFDSPMIIDGIEKWGYVPVY